MKKKNININHFSHLCRVVNVNSSRAIQTMANRGKLCENVYASKLPIAQLVSKNKKNMQQHRVSERSSNPSTEARKHLLLMH